MDRMGIHTRRLATLLMDPMAPPINKLATQPTVLAARHTSELVIRLMGPMAQHINVLVTLFTFQTGKPVKLSATPPIAISGQNT